MADLSKEKTINLDTLNNTDMLKRLEAFKPQGVKANIQNPNLYSFWDESSKQAGKEELSSKFKRVAAEGMISTPSFANVGRTPLMYVDIMLDPLLLFFPKERLDEVNKRFRRIYETHYLVGRIMDLHSTMPNSVVITDQGCVEIQDFLPKGNNPKVLSSTGEFQEVHWADCHDYDGDVFVIESYYRPAVTFTDAHPILTYDVALKEKQWKLAMHVKPGDYVLFPKYKRRQNGSRTGYVSLKPYILNKRYTKTEEYLIPKGGFGKKSDLKIPHKLYLTTEFAELLGWYVAEGCTGDGTNDYQTVLTLGSHEVENIDRVRYLIKTVFQQMPAERKTHDNQSAHQFLIRGGVIGRFLGDKCGHNAHEKKIPTFVMKEDKNFVRAFLRGYLNGDGSHKDHNGANTVSRTLAYQLALLCSKLHIFASIHKLNDGWGIVIKQDDFETILIDNQTRFRRKKNIQNDSWKHLLQDDDYFYIQVKDVKRMYYKGKVYDIKTDDHSFCSSFTVHNSEFPLSDFQLQCEDPEIQQYYNDFKDRVDLVNLCRQMLLEFHLLGEADTYGNCDYNNFEWSDFVQIPPENIDVYGSYISSEQMCFLKPDPNLRDKLSKVNIPDKALTKLWDPGYIADLKENKPHLLDNRRLIRFVRNPNKYTLRGVSLCWRVLHDVLYELKLKMLQLTKADRGMFPLKLFKLGSPEKGWIPSKRHFDEFRRQLIAAANDPDFNIIYHFGVNVEYLGVTDKWADLTSEFEAIEKRIMLGMFANEAVLSGTDTTYASGAVSVRVLMQKYLAIRTLLERALIYKIFLPLARARGFVRRSKAEISHKIRVNSNVWSAKEVFKRVEGKDFHGAMRIANKVSAAGENPREKFYLPGLVWEKLNLLDNTTLQRFVLDLREREEIPFDVVCDVFGWDKSFIDTTMQREMFSIRNPDIKKKMLEYAADDKEIMIRILRGENDIDISKAVASKLEKEILEDAQKKQDTQQKEKEEEKQDEASTEAEPKTIPLSPEEKAESQELPKPLGETEEPVV